MHSPQRKQEFSMTCVLMDMMENELHNQGLAAAKEAQRRQNPDRALASHEHAASNVIQQLESKAPEVVQEEPVKQEPVRKVRKVIRGDPTVAALAWRASAQDGHVRVDNKPVRVRKVRMT